VRIVAATLAALLLAACAPEPVKNTVEAPKPPMAPRPLRTLLATQVPPERTRIRDPYRYLVKMRDIGIPNVTCLTYKPGDRDEPAGFVLTNRGSPQVNPGVPHKRRALRIYEFLFADRARENIFLNVTDDVAVSGRYSQDNMFRELHFYPRLQLPAMQSVDHGHRLKVTLTTGESVLFDAKTKEIVGGVLEEAPLDRNPNRNARRNPGISYHGANLLITVAQRGEDPRLARVWGRTKYAEVYYPAKYKRSCRISPALLWDQRPRPGKPYPSLNSLYPTDPRLFALIEKQCHWDLHELAQRASPGPERRQAALDSPVVSAAK